MLPALELMLTLTNADKVEIGGHRECKHPLEISVMSNLHQPSVEIARKH